MSSSQFVANMKINRNPDYVVIGKVGAPHGVLGLVRIIPLTDFPERFQTLYAVYIKNKLYHVSKCAYHGTKLLLKFEECKSREEVALLTGALLSVPRADAAPLKDGEYYTFDIIGLSVYDTLNNFLGEVVQVLKTGSNDVYVVKNKEGQELLIPALKKVVHEINLPSQRMCINMAELAET